MRARRHLTLLGTGLLAALAFAPAAGGHRPPVAAEPCGAGSDAVKARGAWTVIKAPPGLDRAITAHAAGGPDGRHLLATDGRTVQRSGDGGCTWQPSYDAAQDGIPGVGPVDGVTPKVGRLAFPAGGAGRALLAIDGVAGVLGPEILVSDDQGADWKAGGSGLPATGRIEQIVAPSADPRRVYVTLGGIGDGPDPAGLGGSLYGSDDGGASFTLRSRGATILRAAVDPSRPADVWVVRVGGIVERSTDGGRTFARVSLPNRGDADLSGENDQAWRDVAIAHDAGKGATVVLSAAASADAAVSRVVASVDGGASFLDLPTEGLGPGGGLAFGNSASQLLMVSASGSSAFRGPGLLVYDLGEKAWRDVDDEELIGLRDGQPVALDAARRGHDGLFGLQMRQDRPPGAETDQPPVLARYEPPDAPAGELTSKASCAATGIGKVPEKPTASSLDESDREPAVRFAPDRVNVDLQPGVEKQVPLRVNLSKVPSPLDLSFLIDSSDSMDPAIAGVRCSVERLVRDLRDRRVDGWFGLGQYNDRVEFRYRRLVDVAPPSKVFTDALEDLRTILGREETMRSALFQTATGKGLVATEGDTLARPGKVLIEPGQQVSFRDEALKLVMVIGDEPYETTTPGEPSVAETVSALRDRGIKAIGIRVIPPVFTDGLNPSQRDQFVTRQVTLLQQMQEFARETGAVAPPGGVDCDGGGTPDVRGGEPLVCTVNERGIERSLGDTIATILAAQQDIRDVRLVPRTTSGLAVRVEGGELTGVDVRRRQVLEAATAVSCTAEQAGKRYPLEFAVMAGRAEIGTLAGVATCGALPAAVAPVAPRREPAPKPAKAPPAPAAVQSAPAPAPPPPPPATPQAAVAAAPAPPPPAPVPVASGAASSASAASSSAAASSAPTATGALAAAQENVVEQQVATVRSGEGEHRAVASTPVALQRAPGRERPDAVPTPALVTFGVGFVGAMAWLVLAGGPAGRGRGGAVRRAEARVATPGSRRRRRRRARTR